MTDLVAELPAEATVTELEVLLELSRQAIYRHIKRAGLEPRAKGRLRLYPVEPLVRAIYEHQKADNRNTRATPGKEQKIALEVELLEIRKRQLEGELVNADRVRQRIQALTTSARNRLETIPEQLADELAVETDPNVIDQRLAAEIRSALEDLSRDPIEDTDDEVTEDASED